MLSKLGYGLLKAISYLPFWFIHGTSDVAAWIMFHVIGYRRKTVMENLHNSFPEKSEKEIRKIAAKFYVNLCDVILESVKLLSMDEKTRREHFILHVREEVFEEMAKGHNGIFMFGHCANWEWMTIIQYYVRHIQFWALYQRVENEYFDKKVKKFRECPGTKLIEMYESVRIISKMENDGRNIFAFISDQSPYKDSIRHWVRFLNQDTPAHIGAHQLAVKYGFPVFFLDMRRVKRGYYEVAVELLYSPDERVEKYEIIDRFFARLEKQIREQPENWLWSHRRWKNKRNTTPENER